MRLWSHPVRFPFQQCGPIFIWRFSDISITQAAQPINNCPPPSRIFQGRQTIRDEMNQFFGQEIQKQHIYVLYGLGGAGKTQIALKFISDSSW
jgi:RecA-family ATPase